MQNREDDNVILFPKWKIRLEEESLQALQEKKYDVALSKLDELLSYHITNHEILIGKLICLIELSRYEEAEQLCEYLIKDPDENYYHYLHIYLTILFQTNQYALLMEYIEKEITSKSIPDPIREQFLQLYDLSAEMKQDIDSEKGKAYEQELQEAFETNNYQVQWRILETMRKINYQPTDELVGFLKREEVHPVVKTSILQWLQDLNRSQKITVHKFGLEEIIKPQDLPDIDSHGVTKQTMFLVNELEQSNPTLHQLIKQLFYRYIYVRYPFFPPTEDILPLAQALYDVAVDFMNQPEEKKQETSSKTNQYIEEIDLFQTLYLSIIEE